MDLEFSVSAASGSGSCAVKRPHIQSAPAAIQLATWKVPNSVNMKIPQPNNPSDVSGHGDPCPAAVTALAESRTVRILNSAALRARSGTELPESSDVSPAGLPGFQVHQAFTLDTFTSIRWNSFSTCSGVASSMPNEGRAACTSVPLLACSVKNWMGCMSF